jgi:hypothetical protein
MKSVKAKQFVICFRKREEGVCLHPKSGNPAITSVSILYTQENNKVASSIILSGFTMNLRNCSARYDLSPVIHRIHIILETLTGIWNAWLGTADHWYPACPSDLRNPPPPLFLWQPPPPPPQNVLIEMVFRISDVLLVYMSASAKDCQVIPRSVYFKLYILF